MLTACGKGHVWGCTQPPVEGGLHGGRTQPSVDWNLCGVAHKPMWKEVCMEVAYKSLWNVYCYCIHHVLLFCFLICSCSTLQCNIIIYILYNNVHQIYL